MTDATLAAIRDLLSQCSLEEQETIFRELRKSHLIHEYEKIIGAPAEMILEAFHHAPDLTRRMLRGVIADAAFRTIVIPMLSAGGWNDVTPVGNFAYDYKLDDGHGPVSVQVKLQRSKGGQPLIESGTKYGFVGDVFMTETQKSRQGQDSKNNETRPYRYGEFDVLAVSLQPSTGKWDRYMYTLGRWLLPSENVGEIEKLQPVAQQPNEFWTDNFAVAAVWFRAVDNGKQMKSTAPRRRRQRNKRIKKGMPSNHKLV